MVLNTHNIPFCLFSLKSIFCNSISERYLQNLSRGSVGFCQNCCYRCYVFRSNFRRLGFRQMIVVRRKHVFLRMRMQQLSMCETQHFELAFPSIPCQMITMILNVNLWFEMERLTGMRGRTANKAVADYHCIFA